MMASSSSSRASATRLALIALVCIGSTACGPSSEPAAEPTAAMNTEPDSARDARTLVLHVAGMKKSKGGAT